MKEIGSYAFYQCSALETVTIGERVETFGDRAFYSCSSLKCIYFYGKTSPTVGTNAFYRVPASSVMALETYQNETFGELSVSKGTTNDQCLPPTLTFTESIHFQAHSLNQAQLLKQAHSLHRFRAAQLSLTLLFCHIRCL